MSKNASARRLFLRIAYTSYWHRCILSYLSPAVILILDKIQTGQPFRDTRSCLQVCLNATALYDFSMVVFAIGHQASVSLRSFTFLVPNAVITMVNTAVIAVLISHPNTNGSLTNWA